MANDFEQVVIMLVIDKANDRALLSRQSRFVPRMWSCLAGFIEVWDPLIGIYEIELLFLIGDYVIAYCLIGLIFMH